ATAEDPYTAQGLRPPAGGSVGEGHRRHRPAHRRHHHRSCAAADREERLLRDPLAVQGQGLAGALRGPHAQAADRHPLADPEDGRLAHAARPPGRRRHRDQALAMAKGIVGKKLGMTQLFDEETGAVTSVTVIEAGPCPVVAVRTPDADGYEAVQLAWDAVADRKISKAERGHLSKNGVDGAYRHLIEFRGHFAEAVQGENVTVEI